MAIVDMRKAFIIGRQQDKSEVIEQLQRLNIFEISEIGARLEDEEWSSLLNPDRIPEELDETLNMLSKIDYVIDFLEQFAHEKKSMIDQLLGIKPYIPEDKFQQHLKNKSKCNEIYDECYELDRELNNINNQLNSLENDRAELETWSDLDIPVEEIKDTKLLSITLASVEDVEWESLQNSLQEQIEGYYLEKINSEEKEVNFFLITARSDREILEELFISNEVTPVSLPAKENTVSKNLQDIQQKIEKLKTRKQQIEKTARKLLEEIELLHSHYDACLIKQHRMEIIDSIGATDQLFVIEGWVPADKVEKLEKILSKISVEIVCETREAAEDESPPVALDNPRIIKPFEVVTKLYGTPTQQDVDPTLSTAPFFFVFIGLTLTDAGYGILLSLFSLWGLKKLRLTGMSEKLFQLFFLAGISTFLMGALTGGWFGNLIPIEHIWFNPEASPIYFLLVTFVLGVIQIYAGLGIEFYKNVTAGKTLAALYDQGLWLVFLTGLITKFVLVSLWDTGLVFYLGEIFTYGGVLGLILTQGRASKNIFARLGMGVLSLYDVVQYASDVLSYSRLLALGLATSVIATVINRVAMMVIDVPWLGYILMGLILVAGHMFNFVINLISGYVHTSRLQYVEFYSKFMVAGGDAFNPFGLKTKYLDIGLNKTGKTGSNSKES